MKFQITSLIVGSICFISSGMRAQDLQLESGNKTKTIRAGTYVELELPTANQEPCDKCPLSTLLGELIAFQNGMVKLRVLKSGEPLAEGKINVGSQGKRYHLKDKQPILEIPAELILSITKKGNKKVRENTTGEVVGIVLLFLGTAHLVSSPVAELSEDGGGNLLWKLGMAELLAGTILGTATQQKTFVTSEDCPTKKSSNKIWLIK